MAIDGRNMGVAAACALALATAGMARDRSDVPARPGGGGMTAPSAPTSVRARRDADNERARSADRTALWTRSGKDLLRGFGNMYNLHVVDTPERPYRYRGWFFGWAVKDCNRHIPGYEGCDAIFAARARTLDGPWEVYCGDGVWDAAMNAGRWRPVIAPQREPFDSWHNGDPTVVLVGKRYCMAYSSVGHNKDGVPYGASGDTDGSLLCVMGAVSDDGLTWTRSQAPILLHQEDLGGRTVPSGDAHMHGSYHRPSLLYEGGRFRLWFDYWAGDRDGTSMGYAECTGDFLDPDAWKVIRADARPALRQFPNPDVVRVGRKLYAYGDPPEGSNHPWTARKITEAVSDDGLSWTILGHIRPNPDAPALHVPEAFVERVGAHRVIHLFYACQIGGEPYDYRYDRIRRMERRATSR